MHSIFSDEKECFICGTNRWIEMHHVFGGANKKKSEKYGLMVCLCHFCHNEPPYGVHHNKAKMDWLRAEGQKLFEKNYPEVDFLKEFGKNYL